MPEVTLKDSFGKAIFSTIRKFQFRSCLELGSFDGDGSTQVLIRAASPPIQRFWPTRKSCSRAKRPTKENIEVFFKQIKQTLKLADFLDHSANAVRWQVWSALLCYLLLRYQAFLSGWGKQLYPAFHSDSICSLAAVGLACAFEKLWDSRRGLSSYSHAGMRIFPCFQTLSYGTAARSYC